MINYQKVFRSLTITLEEKIPGGRLTVKQVGKEHQAYKKMRTLQIVLHPIFANRNARLSFMSWFINRWIGSLYDLTVAELYAFERLVYPEDWTQGMSPEFMDFVERSAEVHNEQQT